MDENSKLYEILDYPNPKRKYRQEAANQIISNPDLKESFFSCCFHVEDKVHIKAFWILEFICKHNLYYVSPYLDFFTQKLQIIEHESVVRPAAKICELLTEAYYLKCHFLILNKKNKEQIIENCFHWLISPFKVATKVYSMQSLYLLGTEFQWIHEELIGILTKEYENGSAAYKARSRNIIKKIKKTLMWHHQGFQTNLVVTQISNYYIS